MAADRQAEGGAGPLDADFLALVATGGSLIGAIVGPDGAPIASRCFGGQVLDEQGPLVRVVFDALIPVQVGAAAAITVTNVETFKSRQLKGVVTEVGPLTEADHASMGSYIDSLFAAIQRVNGYPWEILERMIPNRTIAATVRVDESFDQSPGPQAGTRLGSAS